MQKLALMQPYIFTMPIFTLAEENEHLCVFEGNISFKIQLRIVPLCNSVCIVGEHQLQEFKNISQYIDIELEPGNYTVIIRDGITDRISENVHFLRTLIIENNGDITLDDLSAATGYCNRHINRTFTDAFGYGPKDFAKAMRIATVVAEIIKEPNRSNLEFITNSGYSDQAHFQREFKKYMGETPREFIRRLS